MGYLPASVSGLVPGSGVVVLGPSVPEGGLATPLGLPVGVSADWATLPEPTIAAPWVPFGPPPFELSELLLAGLLGSLLVAGGAPDSCCACWTVMFTVLGPLPPPEEPIM